MEQRKLLSVLLRFHRSKSNKSNYIQINLSPPEKQEEKKEKRRRKASKDIAEQQEHLKTLN